MAVARAEEKKAEKKGGRTKKKLDNIRYHCNDTGNEPTQIARKIEQLKQQLAELGPIHPGSLSEQYNVCGKSDCRCKDPKDPQKHGPYYHLSFTWRGRSRTLFVRAEHLAEMREKLANYKRFRELTDEWVDLVVELEQQERGRSR